MGRFHESQKVLGILHLNFPLAVERTRAFRWLGKCYKTDCPGWTILHLLVSGGLVNICDLLFRVACDEDPNLLPTSLTSITKPITSLAKFSKDNIDKKCSAHGIVLYLSMEDNDDSMFRLLLSHGASFEEIDSADQLPIHLAVCQDSVSKLALLEQVEADLSRGSVFSGTPLHGAAVSGNHQCLELLLRKECEVGTQNKPSKYVSPWHL